MTGHSRVFSGRLFSHYIGINACMFFLIYPAERDLLILMDEIEQAAW